MTGKPIDKLTVTLGATVCALPPADQLRFALAHLATIREGGFRDVVDHLIESPEPVLIRAADALDLAAAACREVEQEARDQLLEATLTRILKDG